VKKPIGDFSPEPVSVIVREGLTDEILAFVNDSRYEPNDCAKISVENMTNLAVCKIYEPEPALKSISMPFRLEYNLVDEETIFDCTLTSIMNRYNGLQCPKMR
jgi:cell division protein FtsI/penicillin-binding protein 2